MATAILDFEIENMPESLDGLSGYQRALALIRYRGLPVGKIWLPVQDGAVSPRVLEAALMEMSGEALWRSWQREQLQTGFYQTAAALPSVTIATCTRDRPEDLQNCLKGVLALPDDGQEILVVDNRPSTSATYEVVRQYPRVRYVREDRPGLDAARNRALREARTDVVAFIDDDAVPDSSWLRMLLRNFADPRVMNVNGLTMPVELETEAQEMFERYSGFGRGFFRIVYDSYNVNPLAASRVGAGANMALRRSILDKVGPFDEALDAGTETQSGGDTEMFSRILRSGYHIVYEPAALNWHRHRRSWDALRKVLYGYGVGVYAIWMRQLLFERELTVLKLAAIWFWGYQLPGLVKSLLGRNQSIPAQLQWDELRGCFYGPWAYLKARRKIQQIDRGAAR